MLWFIGAGLDWVFGAGIKSALMKYQEARGLILDGKVGCET